MGFLKPKTPVVPTAGDNIASAIEATLKNQEALREMDRSNMSWDADTIKQLAPGWSDFLLQFEQDYGTKLRDAESKATQETRAGDIANVTALAPSFQEAVAAAADPQAEAIRNLLAGQVQSELAAGQSMSPALQREVEQGIRKAQGARGIVRGSAPVSAEAFARGSRGLQLQQQRQQAATDFLKTTAQTRPDAFTFLTGRSNVAQATPGVAPSVGTDVFGNAMGQAAQANNLQSQLAFNTGSIGAQNKSSLLSGVLGMFS